MPEIWIYWRGLYEGKLHNWMKLQGQQGKRKCIISWLRSGQNVTNCLSYKRKFISHGQRGFDSHWKSMTRSKSFDLTGQFPPLTSNTVWDPGFDFPPTNLNQKKNNFGRGLFPRRPSLRPCSHAQWSNSFLDRFSRPPAVRAPFTCSSVRPITLLVPLLHPLALLLSSSSLW